ncbi:hypothetical protein [Nocardioides sp.]|uniref:hypothetical protein n=1 Tax=Nocardioides sp. TaxID=35761 RepID=UPI0025FE762A|nr:hypothetical protein [Nocardioides sp.]
MTLRRAPNPAPLIVAASLVAIEGLLLVGYAVLELASVSSDRVAVAVTTGVFFAAYGVLLLASARAITRGESWGRSPIVLAQLIQLGVAWSFRGADTTLVALTLAVVALVVLAGLFAPSSIDALSDGEE